MNKVKGCLTVIGVFIVIGIISTIIENISSILSFLGSLFTILIALAVCISIIVVIIKFKTTRRLVLSLLVLAGAFAGFVFSAESLFNGIPEEYTDELFVTLVHTIGVGIAFFIASLCIISCICKKPYFIFVILPWGFLFEALLYLIGFGAILYWQIAVYSLLGVFALLAILYFLRNWKNIMERISRPLNAWRGIKYAPISDATTELIESGIADSDWYMPTTDSEIEATFETSMDLLIVGYKKKDDSSITKLAIPKTYKGNKILGVYLGECQHLVAV